MTHYVIVCDSIPSPVGLRVYIATNQVDHVPCVCEIIVYSMYVADARTCLVCMQSENKECKFRI